jgi:uncharacterized protein YkwD
MLRTLSLTALLLAALPLVAAELLPALEEIRMQGCGGTPGVETSLQRQPALDEVARRLSQGRKLADVLAGGAYPAAKATSIHIEGTAEIPAIAELLKDQYCVAVNNPDFSEVGIFRRKADTWMVLVEPLDLPDPADQETVAREVLERVNAARQESRECGGERFAATRPLELNATLSAVAQDHAQDMASEEAMRHRGSDGSRPSERITRAGYAWRAAAENVAAGQRDAGSVVAHWLASPGHCKNIMSPQFTEIGAGFAVAPKSRGRIYWAQVLAAPRQ